MNASNPHRQELVVVTGASTGIGAATARELTKRGFHVLAGVRRDVDAESLRTDGIEPHILDITVESDVFAIADRVARDPLRRPLRALINRHLDQCAGRNPAHGSLRLRRFAHKEKRQANCVAPQRYLA